ncbi:hypothetical protein ACE1AT_25695 [Pelatocladus sp. BLCC-F211]|uniref:hypothetical protein n=1 Tax=Pelatocladus sp. BLCC-F211 TaxID=3342752 RepID=UPI0035BA00CD
MNTIREGQIQEGDKKHFRLSVNFVDQTLEFASSPDLMNTDFCIFHKFVVFN